MVAGTKYAVAAANNQRSPGGISHIEQVGTHRKKYHMKENTITTHGGDYSVHAGEEEWTEHMYTRRSVYMEGSAHRGE